MGKTFNTGRLGNGLFTDANGNVGIGTTVPDNTYQGLTLYGTNPSLRLKGSATGSWNWIEYVTSAGVNNFSMGVSQSTPLFVIKAGAGLDNPHFTMNTSGYVGIGVTSAIQPLHVETSILNAGIQLYTSEASDGGSAPLFLSKKSTAGSIKTVNIEASGTGNFLIRTGATALNSYGTIRVTVDSTGKMGVGGVTSPLSELHVGGSTTPKITITNTNYPTTYRTILGNKASAAGVLQLGNNGDNYIVGGNQATGGDLRFYVNASSDFIDAINGTEAMRISSNGNIGIADTSPQTKLSINGANYVEMATFAGAATAANIVSNNTGYLSMQTRYNSNSNVFQINTSAPQYGIKILKAGLLHVNLIQDITTSGSSGYVACYIQLNGNNIAEALITNTNSQWDGIMNSVTLAVAANDVISFNFNATDILSFDQGTWSQYNFIWCSR
jgi:hypothetical protein